MSSIEQTAFHFSLDSNLLHKDSDEAQRQLTRQEGESSESSEEESGDEESDGGEKAAEEGGEGRTPDTEGEDPNRSKKLGTTEKRLRNQFNFSERASQTLNNPFRVSKQPNTIDCERINFFFFCRKELLQPNHPQEQIFLPLRIRSVNSF